jgi:AraC-like DNA-binding protein
MEKDIQAMTRRPPNPGRIELPPHWLGLPFLRSGGFHVIHEPLRLGHHTHAGWELTYLEDGEVTWEVEGGIRLRLRGGEFGLIQPDFIHAGELSIIRPCTLFWLIFSLPPAETAAGGFPQKTAAALEAAFCAAGNSVHAASPDLRACFAGLRVRLTESGTAPSDALAEEWLRTLLRQILLAAAGSPATATPPETTELSIAAKRFMMNNLQRDIGVADLARAAGVSPARFSERFKRETGITPADFLRRQRCERARDLLRTSQLPVTDIAFRLGFRSSQHFACVFRKYTGQSPREYRAAAEASL